MGLSRGNKEQVLADVVGGLHRVAQAILAAPIESRVEVIDAVIESYRESARAVLSEAETDQLLEEIMLRLRAEVAARASGQ